MWGDWMEDSIWRDIEKETEKRIEDEERIYRKSHPILSTIQDCLYTIDIILGLDK